MRRPRQERTLEDYEPYDEYYEQRLSPSETEPIDDSVMDPDLVERPFGRIRRPLSDIVPPVWDYLNLTPPLTTRPRSGRRDIR